MKINVPLLLLPVLGITGSGMKNYSQPRTETGKTPPNILVFIADDAGMDYGCYGNDGIITPNLDKLAASGLMFRNAYLTASQCSPSRTSMLSGMFAHTIGTEDLHDGLNDTTEILPTWLKKKGYYTGLMLKGHIGRNGMKQFDWYDNGFADWLKGRWNDIYMDNFKTFLDNKGDKPFFLWMGFVDPHRPYTEDKIVGNRAPEVNDPSKVTVPPWLVDDAGTRKDLAHYYDEITRMDHQVGEMLKELERRGLRDNTLIIYLSDNGMPFPRAKGTVYDAGLHTPLIVSWKGKVPAGSVHDNGYVSTIDLAPTLLEAAGAEIPDYLFGQSMLDIFRDPTKKGRDIVYGERNWHGTDEYLRTILTPEYRLTYCGYPELIFGTPGEIMKSPSWHAVKDASVAGTATGAQKLIFTFPRPRVEMYDVKADPSNLENLAGKAEYQETAETILKQLTDWQTATKDHPYWERRKGDKVDRITGVSGGFGQRTFIAE